MGVLKKIGKTFKKAVKDVGKVGSKTLKFSIKVNRGALKPLGFSSGRLKTNFSPVIGTAANNALTAGLNLGVVGGVAQGFSGSLSSGGSPFIGGGGVGNNGGFFGDLGGFLSGIGGLVEQGQGIFDSFGNHSGQQPVPQSTSGQGMPAWGWVALAAGGVAVLYLVTHKK